MKTVLKLSAAVLLTFSFTGCCCMDHGCGYDPCCDPCGGYGGGYGGGGGYYGGGGACCDPCSGGGWGGGYGQCCPQTCDTGCGHHCCLLDILSIFHCGCLGGGGVGCCAASCCPDPCCDPCGGYGGGGFGPAYSPGYGGGYGGQQFMAPNQVVPSSPPTSMVPYPAHP